MNKKLFFAFYFSCIIIFFSVIFINLLDSDGSTKGSVYGEKYTFDNVSAAIYTSTESLDTPQVSAQSCALIDAKSGAVIFEKNGSAQLPMASTTKIMTAKIILDNMPLEKTVTVPKEAAFVEGSSIYLQPEEKITVETLLYGLLLESGNDAAHALAVSCSGSIEEFAALMNKTAQEIGLTHTSFANPHGLTADNHYTTATELAFITAEAMKNEKFKEIVSTKKLLAPSLDGKFTRLFLNHNKLLRLYDGAVGVKTGYTKAAGRCLVSAAEREGDLFIAVTLNDGNDWNDHKEMLDFAFENFDTVEIAHKDTFAIYCEGFKYLVADSIYLTVSKGTNPLITYSVNIGKDSGEVRYFADGIELGKFMIYPE